MVTRLLDRKEMISDPEARKAVKAEGAALIEEGTWLEDTIINRDDPIAWARKNNKKIHMGDLLAICSIKYAECEKHLWKYKGRICFRGDNVKDEYGAMAVFQQMSASPTTVNTANSTIAYGMLHVGARCNS